MASMQITFPMAAPNGERFAPEAFSSSIGKVVAISYNGQPIGNGRILRAVVSTDGTITEVTYETV